MVYESFKKSIAHTVYYIFCNARKKNSFQLFMTAVKMQNEESFQREFVLFKNIKHKINGRRNRFSATVKINAKVAN